MINRLKFHNVKLGVITFIVVTAHLVFVFTEFGKKLNQVKKNHAIVVRTYTPQKEKKAVQIQTLEKPKPAPKQVKKKLEVKKTEKKVEQKQPQKKVETKKVAKSLAVPVAIESLHVDEVIESEIPLEKSSDRGDYLGIMIDHLQRSLELPEEGSVRLELTVLKSGEIKKMKILASESKTNQQYLEMHLPLVQCPRFTGDWGNFYEQTVVFTFCNEKS